MSGRRHTCRWVLAAAVRGGARSGCGVANDQQAAAGELQGRCTCSSCCEAVPGRMLRCCVVTWLMIGPPMLLPPAGRWQRWCWHHTPPCGPGCGTSTKCSRWGWLGALKPGIIKSGTVWTVQSCLEPGSCLFYSPATNPSPASLFVHHTLCRSLGSTWAGAHTRCCASCCERPSSCTGMSGARAAYLAPLPGMPPCLPCHGGLLT